MHFVSNQTTASIPHRWFNRFLRRSLSIAITPMDEAPLIENHDVDTAALIHGADEDALPILLPLPVLPYVPDGSVLAVEANSTGRLSYIQTQPFLVEEQPRPIDVLHLNLRVWSTFLEFKFCRRCLLGL